MNEIDFKEMKLDEQIADVSYNFKGIMNTLEFLREAMDDGQQTEETMQIQASLDLIISQAHTTFDKLTYIVDKSQYNKK